MKIVKIFIITFILFNYIFNQKLSARIDSTIITKVNGQIITTVDLENELKTYFIMNNIDFTEKNINQYKNLILDGMIKRLIKKGEIKKFKIKKYNEVDFNEYITNIAVTKGLQAFELPDFFKKNDLDYDQFKDNIIIQLKWNNLILNLYAGEVNLSESEVQGELQKYSKEIYSGEKSYKISEIVLSLQDKEKVQEIQNFIVSNGFEKAASTYSIADSSLRGGSLGWLATSELNESLLNNLKNLKIGEITDPINRLDQIIILRLDETKLIKRSEKDVSIIKRNIINRLRSEKLNFFSISHFSKAEKASVIKIIK